MPSFFDAWLPFIYLYGVGGIFFFSGIIIIKKSGAINLSKKRNKFWLRVMLFGFFYFVALHFLVNIAALYF
ncbi:MAG: hypothetical protein KJN64_02605 [Ignavibacteria bacterium]|nr:hypothetical protein [Ignavibacteria bacterium]MBT8382148.1 hypothetical protein [Ignavibacteria bacterium]MBT8390706.1 hypothetical protein [Ignavibacteria bacterium]NNJ53671.1 hypothetical protein [Ignavibacteriaceae bacterium]NNL22509.1 hypothetical protein [Ignavibacteriaceae bacterium]